ncbi:MAG: hypothetical protein R6V58_02750 [Planctomycetota bacterium]
MKKIVESALVVVHLEQHRAWLWVVGQAERHLVHDPGQFRGASRTDRDPAEVQAAFQLLMDGADLQRDENMGFDVPTAAGHPNR